MSMKVYAAICAVTEEMSRQGITKSRRNAQQGYNFRGIDDVYNTLSPMLAKHKLCILPRVIEHSVVERQTAKGGTLFYTTVKVDFDFVSAEDGSKHTITMIGEAMDSADKSSNKAQSAAYKYAAFQAFAIPTEGDNDADAHTPEVAAVQMPAGLLEAAQAAALEGAESFREYWKRLTPASRSALRDHIPSLKAAAEAADKPAELAEAA